MMHRRDFLRSAAGLGALIAIAPHVAIARITPPEEPDDAAEIQALIDNARPGDTVVLANRTYTLRRPVVLRSGGAFTMDQNYVVVTGQAAFRCTPTTARVRITNNYFDHKPSLLTRIAQRFA